MVSRSEQILYGLIGVFVITLYQGTVQDWFLQSVFGSTTGLAHMLVGNIVVYLLSVMVTYVLIKRIRKSRMEAVA